MDTTISGTPLFVSQFGRGTPLLCLLGIEAHGLRVQQLAARLAGVQAVAPDLRGHGHSPRTGPWTMAQHMADLGAILRDWARKPSSLATRVAFIKSELGDALDHRVLDVSHTIPSDHPDLLAALMTELMASLGAG